MLPLTPIRLMEMVSRLFLHILIVFSLMDTPAFIAIVAAVIVNMIIREGDDRVRRIADAHAKADVVVLPGVDLEDLEVGDQVEAIRVIPNLLVLAPAETADVLGIDLVDVDSA